MIQEIEPKLNNAYMEKRPEPDDKMLAFLGDAIYVKKGKCVEFLTYKILIQWCEKKNVALPQSVYLFSIGQENYFLTELPEEVTGLPGAEEYAYVRMFEMRSKKPKERVFAAATAWHLFVWYRDNRFCGRCGKPVVHSKKLRMLQCPVCKNMIFPKVAPAVIVGVTDGDRILMTKYAGREYKRYALIAGFTEIGETAEETVQREVMEEVGIRVKNIRYYKSQPWGFDSNLLLGYFCELDGSGKIRLDEEELATAEWVDYRDIPDDPEGLSLTRAMMTAFRISKEKVLDSIK